MSMDVRFFNSPNKVSSLLRSVSVAVFFSFALLVSAHGQVLPVSATPPNAMPAGVQSITRRSARRAGSRS